MLAIPLSRDHKPNNVAEASNIISHNGRIESYKNEHGDKAGPLRVWIQHSEFPGLLITRAFGDSIGAQVGIHCIPEIEVHNLCRDDKYIILGSDGIWTKITNQEAADIVYPYYMKDTAEDAAKALIKEAECRWRQSDVQMDDITCIVVFLGYE